MNQANGESQDVKRHGLRAEARSVEFDKLSQDQQRAFTVLVELLAAAHEDLPGQDEWRRNPTFDRGLDENSTSRVLLLGGGRGSGKTTVAATLQRALQTKKRLFSDKNTDVRTTQQERLEVEVRELRPNVIVLEPLSMEDTPKDANILAALLARIEHLLFPKLTHEDVPSTSSDQKRHNAVLELLRLQTDVAMAWNGNLGDRKGHLDPDNYAMEELRVERVRLQLRDRFATVLRRTARDSLEHENPAMFLLIIDDADVNPEQTIDTVERLRMVGVVELVVLLVGDIDTMETVFRLNFAGRFRRTGAPCVANDIGMHGQDMATLTNRLARSALRKHVPYHQRVMLASLKPPETLDIVPFGQIGKKLRERLQGVAVCRPGRNQPDTEAPDTEAPDTEVDVKAMQLDEFICPPAAPWGETGEQRQAPSWYVGSTVLADSPRVAVDLWNTLLDVEATRSPNVNTEPGDRWQKAGHEKNPYEPPKLDVRLHELFRRLAGERLDANTKLWKDESTFIDEELRTSILREGNLSRLNLRVRHRVPESPVESYDVKLEPRSETPRTLYVSLIGSVDFWVGENPVSRDEIGPLMLAEDLWSLEYRTAAKQSTAARSRAELRWVVYEDARSVDEQAALKRAMTSAAGAGSDGAAAKDGAAGKDGAVKAIASPRERGGVPWPIPRYTTIRQVEQFDDLWNWFLRSEPRKATGVELTEAWIVLHTEVFSGELFTASADQAAADPDDQDVEDDAGSFPGALRLGRVDTDRSEELRTLLDRLAGFAEQLEDRWLRSQAENWLLAVDWLVSEFARGSDRPGWWPVVPSDGDQGNRPSQAEESEAEESEAEESEAEESAAEESPLARFLGRDDLARLRVDFDNELRRVR